jgi:hypothetical protein
MQDKHAMLMANFLQQGFSDYFIKKINGYYNDRNGYLQKAYVKIGNLYEIV